MRFERGSGETIEEEVPEQLKDARVRFAAVQGAEIRAFVFPSDEEDRVVRVMRVRELMEALEETFVVVGGRMVVRVFVEFDNDETGELLGEIDGSKSETYPDVREEATRGAITIIAEGSVIPEGRHGTGVMNEIDGEKFVKDGQTTSVVKGANDMGEEMDHARDDRGMRTFRAMCRAGGVLVAGAATERSP